MNEIKRLQQLAGIITEIRVNNPTNIQFDDLKVGESYNFTYNDGDGEVKEKLEVIYFDNGNGENNEKFITVLGEDGDYELRDDFDLYPSDIISISK